jgi:hypothetical protein
MICETCDQTDVLVAGGNAWGAVAAWAVGKVTSNTALVDVAIEGMEENANNFKGAVGAQIVGGLKMPEEAPTEVVVESAQHPEAVQHIQEAQAAGHPSVLTVNRPVAPANRRAAQEGTKIVKGKDRDEYPPAMTTEGGKGASVKHIDPHDNRGAGASIRRQCTHVKDGGKIRIVCK